MAHKHSVYDTEPHFQIDKTSREIKNVSATKTTITQFDHNSERFTFEIPRFIDGHDMSLCNNVQVHYINIDSTDKTNKIIGVYTVEDLQLSPEDENIVICSWLISQNATQLAGSLVFLLRFACVTDEVLDYAWNTARCTTISVSNGLYNGEAIIEEYFDILSVWEQNIIADVTDGIDKTIEEKVDNVKIVETATGNAITIDSSEAPIPYLKLIGKTTKDGNTLTSSGDSGSFEVGVYGKNMLPHPYYFSGTSTLNGVTYTVNDDRGITFNGTATADIGVPIQRVVGIVGKHYTISGSKVGVTLNARAFNIENNTSISWADSANGNAISKVFPNGYTHIIQQFYIKSGTTLNNVTIYPQIEVGTEATPYEPCNKQTLTMPYTLRSVPNATSTGEALGVGETSDIVDFNKGTKTENILKVTLDGTESMREHANGMLYVQLHGEKTDKKFKAGCGLCDQLTNAFTNKATGKVFHIGGEGIYIGKNDSFSTVDELKAYLTTNPMTFYITSQTPIETPLTETELNAYRQLMTNKGTTTILSESDMEILYYVNKPNAQVIGNIHTQINKDYLKLHSTLQSEG